MTDGRRGARSDVAGRPAEGTTVRARTRPPSSSDRSTRPTYREDVLDVLLNLLAGHPDVSPGKMFGLPAFYARGKLFACLYGDGVGLKLPEEAARALQDDPDVFPFQPYGKPKMREWIEIRRPRAADYADDLGLFLASIDFVSETVGQRQPRARSRARVWGGRPTARRM